MEAVLNGQYVLCLLRDPFTKGEKTLIAAARGRRP
jgi:hypothetical protein